MEPPQDPDARRETWKVIKGYGKLHELLVLIPFFNLTSHLILIVDFPELEHFYYIYLFSFKEATFAAIKSDFVLSIANLSISNLLFNPGTSLSGKLKVMRLK